MSVSDAPRARLLFLLLASTLGAQAAAAIRPWGGAGHDTMSGKPGAAQERPAETTDRRLVCGQLLVFIQSPGSAASVQQVSCSRGSNLGILPPSATAGINQPAVVALAQAGAAGPDCRIVVVKSGGTIVLAARQDACAAQPGNVTAVVLSGSAVVNGTATGSSVQGLPGLAWFTVY